MEKFKALKQLVNSEEFFHDVDRFYNRHNHRAGTRVRKGLATIKRACQAMRQEVQDIRMERKTRKPE